MSSPIIFQLRTTVRISQSVGTKILLVLMNK